MTKCNWGSVKNNKYERLIADNNLNSVADVYSMLRNSVKDILKKLMETELDSSLDYGKKQKGDIAVVGVTGILPPPKNQYRELQINVFREPKIIHKCQRNMSSIDDKALSFYTRDINTRNIHDQMQELNSFKYVSHNDLKKSSSDFKSVYNTPMKRLPCRNEKIKEK